MCVGYLGGVFIRELRSRVTVLDAVSNDPYHLFAAGMSTDVRGRLFDLPYTGQAALWSGTGPLGRLAHGAGDPSVISVALAEARTADILDGVAWINLWRMTRAQVPDGWVHRPSRR